MKAPSFEARWTGWAAGYGGSNRTNGDAVIGSHDLTSRVAGYAGGLDYRITHDTAVGFALAGGGTNWGLSDGLGGGRSDAVAGGRLCRDAFGAGLSVDGARLHLASDVDRSRRLRRQPLDRGLPCAKSRRTRRDRLPLRLQAASALTPYAALQVQNLRTPSYAETDLNGGGFALAYAGRSATDTRSELGARLDHRILLDNKAVLALRVRAAWAHHWVSDRDAVRHVPGAAGRELHRQWRVGGKRLSASLRRRGPAPRQWRLVQRQIRWRIRRPLQHLCRNRRRTHALVTESRTALALTDRGRGYKPPTETEALHFAI